MTFEEYRDEFGYVNTKDELICTLASMGKTSDEIQEIWSDLEDEWMDYCDDQGIEAEHN
jgi:hypothetical protein